LDRQEFQQKKVDKLIELQKKQYDELKEKIQSNKKPLILPETNN
jgi:hypothetical protein